MKPFDYIYFRIYKFYLSLGQSGPWAFGIPAMAMSQYFILVTLDKIFIKLGGQGEYLTGRTGYIVMTIILIFNFIRYKWLVTFDTLQIKWDDENHSRKAFRGTIVLIYLFGSLISGLYVTGFFNRNID